MVEPRQEVMPQLPVRAQRATFPRAMMTFGWQASISRLRSSIPSRTTGRHHLPARSTCASVRSAFRSAKKTETSLPGGRFRMTLVTKQTERRIPASCSIRSSSLPEGPTKGMPFRSSSSPGASPTIMILAGHGPVGCILLPFAISAIAPGCVVGQADEDHPPTIVNQWLQTIACVRLDLRGHGVVPFEKTNFPDLETSENAEIALQGPISQGLHPINLRGREAC